eukprot:CAMPEP_0181500342 /NCGR_PEP_ID=MMETSP1110-20121109/55167_1 /TAXON_ID=174948 /ORGANISM="Symbiodinium sp., Strain CCMP421" /LENGTH=35 /DNA_ID= /DNA_START= /DNA_END= /DNA_ORIENTATION=
MGSCTSHSLRSWKWSFTLGSQVGVNVFPNSSFHAG